MYINIIQKLYEAEFVGFTKVDSVEFSYLKETTRDLYEELSCSFDDSQMKKINEYINTMIQLFNLEKEECYVKGFSVAHALSFQAMSIAQKED